MIQAEQPVHHLTMKFGRKDVDFIDFSNNNDEDDNRIYIGLKPLSNLIEVKVSNIKNAINNHIDEFIEYLMFKTGYEEKLYQRFTSNINILKISSVNIFINEEGVYSYTMLSRSKRGKEFRITIRKLLREYRIGKKEIEARYNPDQPTQIAIIEKMVSQFKIHEQKLILEFVKIPAFLKITSVQLILDGLI